MKLLHLSDLHLGKRIKNFPLLEDQAYILQAILEILDAERPDAVLIAGDVYDRATPSTEAVELLDRFLVSLAGPAGIAHQRKPRFAGTSGLWRAVPGKEQNFHLPRV